MWKAGQYLPLAPPISVGFIDAAWTLIRTSSPRVICGVGRSKISHLEGGPDLRVQRERIVSGIEGAIDDGQERGKINVLQSERYFLN